MFQLALKISLILITLLGFCTIANGKEGQAIRVVSTIHPIHLLAKDLTKGVLIPTLLVKPSTSEHDMSISPSQARMLSHADIVFMIDPQLERAVPKLINSLSPKPELVILSQSRGLSLLPMSSHHEHDSEHDHEPSVDLHIWLDPNNAIAMVDTMLKQLVKHDPDHRTIYFKNAAKLKEDIGATRARILSLFKKRSYRPYMVYHDAYRYFEQRFHVHPTAHFTVTPDRLAGAKTYQHLQNLLQNEPIACFYVEPQFDTTKTTRLLGTSKKHITIGVLDPLGYTLPSYARYTDLLNAIALALESCILEE